MTKSTPGNLHPNDPDNVWPDDGSEDRAREEAGGMMTQDTDLPPLPKVDPFDLNSTTYTEPRVLAWGRKCYEAGRASTNREPRAPGAPQSVVQAAYRVCEMWHREPFCVGGPIAELWLALAEPAPPNVSGKDDRPEALRQDQPEKGAAALREALRPEVLAFALAMERKLRENDWKPGWKNDASGPLMARVCEEFGEFQSAHLNYPRGTDDYKRKLLDEAADVANMMMMVVDVCGALAGETPPTDSAVALREALTAARPFVRDMAESFGRDPNAVRALAKIDDALAGETP